MLIAHISDLHLTAKHLAYGVVDTESAFIGAVNWLKHLDPQPDVCLVTGDIADDGSEQAYEKAGNIFSGITIPFRVLPGNHDHKPRLEQALMRNQRIVRFGHRICWSEAIGGLRIIGIDTVIPGKHHGGVSLDLLEWLEDELEQSKDAPVLLCMHHPPLPLGIAPMDRTPFERAKEFSLALAGRSNVLRLLAGHAHRPMVQEFGGRPLFVAPSTGLQLELNLLEDAQENFMLEPNGLALHLLRNDWQDQPTLISHLVALPGTGARFPGPFPFYDLILPCQGQ